MSSTSVVQRTWPCSLQAPAAARRFVRSVLASRGLSHDPGTATLVVSELVTNAVRHAGGPDVTVRVDTEHDQVLIEVVDRGDGVGPLLSRHPVDDESGRGLHIVEAVSADWGVRHDGGCTVVWCRLV